ncbi:hypothetical protein IQ276_001300 [Desmonostoc muscorum LEGE 12446]|uniref:Uncharacterized protein n=1 Tax=Desmonostoc muscorum LEGE 12446 TaxID=1828758 RepID=A0A8J7AC01_DESMC|nr:hypothetical protein [Desmonostoc muscorum]MCF2145107.1 hypothetical protein [Desmonostoc muscorum LEGE 12446]
MIYFQNLQVSVDDRYSFVGIKKQNSKLIFYLPKGFDISSFNTYESKKTLFFKLYKILRKYKEICIEKGYLQSKHDIKAQDRDGVIKILGSIQNIILPDTNEENIYYSKLNSFDSILNTYDELKIFSLVYRLGINENINYSQLHRFLDKAVYLNNGAIYIDKITSHKRIIHYHSTDIVAMFCYIFVEIKQQLNEKVNSEVAALSERFKYKYIDSSYGLFNEESSSQIVNILKDALELIDKHTAIKDYDYWSFYESIELFLYGDMSKTDEGEVWGIKNFYSVWESMCLTYIVKNIKPEYILHLDTKYLSHHTLAIANSKPKIISLSGVFTMNSKKLIPDAVVYYHQLDNLNGKINNTLNSKENFVLTKDNWDDYGYKTSFTCTTILDNQTLGIAYKGQPTNKHTFIELEKIYPKIDNSLLSINHQLPSNFYSFWSINEDEIITSDKLALMYRLNHIFYIAIKNGVCTRDSFCNFLLNTFQIHIENNVFKTSLFRGYAYNFIRYIKNGLSDDEGDEMVSMFENFIQKISYLCLIDVKYLLSNYLLDQNNIKEIKDRSVRKQFTYEYLLQEFIEKNKHFSDIEIISRFWLPTYKNDCPLVEPASGFLDDYIGLRNLNFTIIADSYVD